MKRGSMAAYKSRLCLYRISSPSQSLKVPWRRLLTGLLLYALTMGNDIGHERYCCGESGKLERRATEQKTPAAHGPIAQAAPGAVPCGENGLAEEKSRDAATGTRNEDVGRENGTASRSLPVAQAVVRTAEETQNEPVSPRADRRTRAPARGGPAAAQQGEGAAGLTTTDLAGAGGAASEPATAGSTSAAPGRPRCKPSPVCRWLKKLRSPPEKAQVKPEAITSKE